MGQKPGQGISFAPSLRSSTAVCGWAAKEFPYSTPSATASGVRPLFFRAPAGLRNPFLEPVLCRLGLHLASWTRRGFDTRTRDAAVVTQRLLRGLAPRDILLVHDGHPARDARNRPVVLDVLPAVLEAASTAQLRCTTLRAAIAPGVGQDGEDDGARTLFATMDR